MPVPLEMLGKKIRIARDKLGMTQEDLAHAVGLGSGQIVSAIEKGDRDVKAFELQKICKLLRVDLAEMLAPEPVHYNPAALWRAEPIAKLDTEALLDLRCRRYRRLIGLVCGDQGKPLVKRTDFDPIAVNYPELESIALDTATELHLGPYPAREIFDALERDCTVMVFFADLGSNGSALSVSGPVGDAVLLNKSEAPWRRSYSCAHELYHLITWEMVDRNSLEQNAAVLTRLEQKADAFASALLLPRNTFLPVFRDRVQNGKITTEDIVRLAREFGVSTSALLYRAANLGLVHHADVAGILEDSDLRAHDRRTMASQWHTPDDLPSRFVDLALIAYSRGLLSKALLAEYLETDITSVPEMLRERGLNIEMSGAYEASINPT